MTTTVTINGVTYTDDQMDNGNHVLYFFPMLQDLMTVIATVAINTAALDAAVAEVEAKTLIATTAANEAAASAASAVLAPGTSATSTTSLSVTAGIKTLTIQTGKMFVIGQHVIIADTTSPATRQMTGIVSAHNSGTGALTVEVSASGLIGAGTVATWTISLSGVRGMSSVLTLPMLSTSAALQTCISPMMPIFDSSHAIAAVDFIRIMWAGSQFVAVPSAASVNVFTSPDLKVWTARSVSGASWAWTIRNNGANLIACQSSGNAPCKSTNGGVTWTPATALPVVLNPVNAAYTSGGVFFVGTTTAGYVSTDNGTTWSASQTLPHTSSNVMTIGNLMLSYSTGSGTYYTSSTGLTGSWTARTMPASITAASIYDDGSNGLILVPTDTTRNFWGSTDGINWTDLGFNPSSYVHGGINAATYYVPMKINGCWVIGSNHAGIGSVLVKHGSAKWMPTQTWASPLSLTTAKFSLVANNGSGTYGVKPAGSNNIMIADNSSTKCIGFFI